jgi:hypothetical protein
MEPVFVSSLARGEMAQMRSAARAAIDSLQMRPVMFETVPASRNDSRRALLDELGDCDVCLLLLGAEYGEPTERGVSATEDEFNEAVSRAIPVIALVQDIAHTPEQQEFVRRVRGSWSDGRFAPTFKDATDVGFAVVRALNAWRQRGAMGELQAAVLERARTLAAGSDRHGLAGAKARIVFVPVLGRPIMDATLLGERELADDLGMCARSSKLVSHDMALRHTIAKEGIEFEASAARGYEQLRLLVATDGSIVAEGEIASTSDFFRSSVVEASRLTTVIRESCWFAACAWKRVDRRDDIRQVATTVVIPDASMKVFSDEAFRGSSLSLGSFAASASVIMAPDPARVVRREDLGSERFVDESVAEVRRAFQLVGRTH